MRKRYMYIWFDETWKAQNKTKHWLFAKRKKEKCRKTFHLKFLSSAFVDDSVALSRDVVEVIS